ncbi:MAG: phenylalanine--tRNA ligase subunit alpha [Pirellulaceae bacterium]
MSLQVFLESLDSLERQAREQFAGVVDAAGLESLRVEFLGAKNGLLKSAQKQLGTVPATDKPAAGKRFNEVREAIESLLEETSSRLGDRTASKPTGPLPDCTLPGVPPHLGHLHPITQTIELLKEIMGRLGFTVTEGPEVEDVWNNFVALNIPEDHVARDPADNFYLQPIDKKKSDEAPALLRSQTSTVQIRVMETTKPPIRIISLGRVYRPDEADATHYPMFHQMEGLWVDQHVTMAQLKSVLRMFATSYLGGDVQIRFRPSFFPFTEPSVEVDFFWNDQWMEFGGAGMVDPNVLTSVGIDPDRYSGFAFGLGVERLCMRRFGITDIRELYRNDVRFLRQF